MLSYESNFLMLLAAGVGFVGAFVSLSFMAIYYLRQEARLPAATALEDVAERVDLRREELAGIEQKIAERGAELAHRDQVTHEIEYLLERRREIEADIHSHASRVEELEVVKRELATAHEDLAAARQRKAEIEGETEAEERRRREAAHAAEEAEARLERLRQSVDETQQELRRLEVARSDLERAHAEAERRHAARAEELEAVERNLASQLEELAEARRRKAEIEDEITAAERRQREADHAAEMAAHRLEQIRRAHDETAEALRRDYEIKASLDRDLAELRSRQAGERQALEELQRDVARQAGERDRLAQEIDRLAHEKHGLERDMRTMKQKLGDLENDVSAAGQLSEEQARKRLEELRKPPECLDTPAKNRLAARQRDAGDEVAALDRVQTHLQSIGLTFPRRTLNAFHTALKTSRISPLTVLAGISGTGKSQLPMRYADAMGMHSLLVAVQPRWDSPQDLFGFYNYLESRYKATELARALVHLDMHNWKEQAEPYRDRMLMVLFDEMNLARVEYYFSELLSKLEMRPKDDIGIGEAPANAAIELDLGPAMAHQKNRVYAGDNLLFVGTMNEDESTQTLSDKVMDRANVLRFTRPSSLSSALPSDGATTAADGYLPLKTWQSWRRSGADLDQARLAALQGWIDKLNTALADLGRPFGHRVNQAILSYVANYPDYRSDRSMRAAFADQLDQRIFPKLRGVEESDETQGPLEEIRKLAQDDLKDQALADAFDKSRRELFVWQGVARSEDA